MQTVIVLWGSSGVGKSALVQLMQSGRRDLIASPFLRQVMDEGFALPSPQTVREFQQGQGDLRAAVRRDLGDQPVFVDDLGLWQETLALADEYRIVVVALFAYPWLVEARREIRYQAIPTEPSQARTAGVLPDRDLVDYLATQLAPQYETVVVDVSDYPVREMTVADAYAMVTGHSREPELPDPKTMYQQCLRVEGQWYGSPDQGRRAFEQARLDSLLPEHLSGLTVLDIGASEGGMLTEALHRRAAYALGLELREAQVAVMREVRTARQLPLSAMVFDLTAQEIPPLTVHYGRQRWDVTLLLNVLHHFEQPEPLLRKVLGATDRLILEGPFGMGLEPYRTEPAEYRGTGPLPRPGTALPPHWVARVAREEGFVVTAMWPSTMCPGQRLAWDLVRQ